MSTLIPYSIDHGDTIYYSSIAAKVFGIGQMKASNVNSFQLVVLIEACFHGDMHSCSSLKSNSVFDVDV